MGFQFVVASKDGVSDRVGHPCSVPDHTMHVVFPGITAHEQGMS